MSDIYELGYDVKCIGFNTRIGGKLKHEKNPSSYIEFARNYGEKITEMMNKGNVVAVFPEELIKELGVKVKSVRAVTVSLNRVLCKYGIRAREIKMTCGRKTEKSIIMYNRDLSHIEIDLSLVDDNCKSCKCDKTSRNCNGRRTLIVFVELE